jgi:hypothetical protein
MSAVLMDECENWGETEDAGAISLDEFHGLLIERQHVLHLDVKQCQFMDMRLDEILRTQAEFTLVSDGSGHTVGVSSSAKVLVDSDPAFPLPIDLRESGTAKLAAQLGLKPHSIVNALFITASTCL